MDSYEATKVVFSRIQTLDPENASKIMGYLLLQDHGEKELIRLAFGPDTNLHNLILKAKTNLGLSSNSNPNTPSSLSSSPFNPISRPITNPLSSSRMTSNGFDNMMITNPSSPSSNSACWPRSTSFSTPSLSYASVVKETSNIGSGSSSSSSSSLLSSALPYNTSSSSSSELIDHDQYQLQDHFAFLNDSKMDDLYDPSAYYAESAFHKRSYLAPSMCFGSEDASSGLGWKPCLYFARGFCKNGSTCRFLHSDSVDATTTAAINVGSPSKLNEFEQCQELLRSKAAHQQKLAAASQFMAGASFPYNKCLNFLMQQQNDTQRSAAALMMGDELHKFGRCPPESNDFSSIGLGGIVNPGSRQIYLTFPADSTFREEDVSNYFSIYGPVQDVRIPYQQKRMFGFVTFVYPETVKMILAKGNPHFVCDSRVLVKPYKEKGKIPDKKQQHQQQQQLERGEYSMCSSPSGLDSREPFDLHLGARMFYDTQEILMRRKLEEQAIELQGRRLMNLQLLDFKNNHQHYHPHQYHHNLSAVGSPIPSPTLTHTPNNQTLILPPDGIDQQVPTEKCGNPAEDEDDQHQLLKEMNSACNINGNSNSSGKEEKSNPEESELSESLEHILPDSLFACPKKSADDNHTVLSTAPVEANENTSTLSSNNNQLLPSASPLTMATMKNVFAKCPGFLLGMECS
nr:zinc finger CCCH domain-containing protein 22-like isoform X2 [Quercus suber]POE46049.1 zinc finger ccch domain-containing protein 22 [Quercus suber]